MLRIISLILAISATAYTLSPLSRSSEEYYYGNPWNADKTVAKCLGSLFGEPTQRLDVYDVKTPEGDTKYAHCEPILGGNLAACPKPENYNKGLSAYNTMNTHDGKDDIHKHFCVEECSYNHGSCPSGSVCHAAPRYLMNPEGTVNYVCMYPNNSKPPPPPPTPGLVYEDPWIKDPINGKCNKFNWNAKTVDEDVYAHTTADGTVYGICRPTQYGNLSSCPPPPGFPDSGIDGYDSKEHCYLECSRKGSSCPKGSECLSAPAEIINSTSKPYLHNICMYPKQSKIGYEKYIAAETA